MHWRAPLLIGLMALAGCDGLGMTPEQRAARDQKDARVAELRLRYPDNPEFFRQSIGDTVYFASDSSALSPEARARLRRQAQWLALNTGYDAVIEGYADDRGPRGHNMPLAARRSQAIAAYLASVGLPRDRLRAVTFGEEEPARLCQEAACLQENRRAITVLVREDLL